MVGQRQINEVYQRPTLLRKLVLFSFQGLDGETIAL
jgi:hypothetical protein